jgi:hypothetical protein
VGRLGRGSARRSWLVEDFHLGLGETTVGVVDPHVSDNPIKFGPACEGDPVGEVVDSHASPHTALEHPRLFRP